MAFWLGHASPWSLAKSAIASSTAFAVEFPTVTVFAHVRASTDMAATPPP
ncbi:hypothetical protein OCOJLMKI_0081 [Methylobacterium iners]|uniref:Uncharacterized protein n=1 Tax=Methylobacterium iners TaxID=418707 RepID=A0ABQ4RT98_9HYPH|nr:hypothetical protein OCOJLMKI_0081 [Methylobacterium iners]